MRLIAALALTLCAAPALAAECGAWTASMEEDEGGPQMMAYICASASSSTPEAVHSVMMTCSGNGLLIRYAPFAPDNYPPAGNEEFKGQLELSVDQSKLTLDAQYEGMDGAMSMATEMKDPFVTAMAGGKELTVTDPKGQVPGATFTLKGAKKALKKLAATCEK